MLEKTKTIIAPVAAAAAMVGTNPNALAADAEANQTQKTVGAIATANQANSGATAVNEAVKNVDTASADEVEIIEKIFDKNPNESHTSESAMESDDPYTPPQTGSPLPAAESIEGGQLNTDIQKGLEKMGQHFDNMEFDAAEELALPIFDPQHGVSSKALDKDPSKGPISTDSNHPEEEKRPNIVETPPVDQQPSEEDTFPPKNPYQPPEAQNPMGELAPNETGPLNNGLRDGVAVIEQHFSEMTDDPYQPPRAVETPATKTPATGQNNGSESGAPAEVPAP